MELVALVAMVALMVLVAIVALMALVAIVALIVLVAIVALMALAALRAVELLVTLMALADFFIFCLITHHTICSNVIAQFVAVGRSCRVVVKSSVCGLGSFCCIGHVRYW